MLTGFNNQMVKPYNPDSPENRTFDWGESGQIVMKPFEEAASAWFGTSQPESKQQADNSPVGLLQQQHTQALDNLNQQFEQNKQLLTKDSKYAAESVDNEFSIKLNAVAAKYGISPEQIQSGRISQGKFTPEESNKIRNEINNLNTQYTLAMQKISDKIKPGLDELEMTKQQQLSELQQGLDSKKFRIQVVQDLVDKGVIKDPAAAMQEQYQIAGISVPVSEFRGQTPRQQLNDIQATIRALRSQIPKELTFYIDENGQEQMLLAGEVPPELQQQISELENMERQLLPQIFPQYIKSPAQVKPLNRAAERALTGDGQQGGTLAGRVTVAKNNQQPQKIPAEKMMQQLKDYWGMSKEDAISWMRENGY